MSDERLSVSICLLAYGGVIPQTHDCIVRDTLTLAGRCNLYYATVFNDADVGRCRGKMATKFLQENKADIFVMIDHDMEWQPGDLWHLVSACTRTRGVVGGVVSLRAFGQGIASRFCKPGAYSTGMDTIEPATYVGSAFMAIHRDALMTVARKLQMHHDNWFPFFQQEQRFHPEHAAAKEHLSEDWAFCARCIDAGVPVHVDLYPRILHHGHYAYGVADAQSQDPNTLRQEVERLNAQQAVSANAGSQ